MKPLRASGSVDARSDEIDDHIVRRKTPVRDDVLDFATDRSGAFDRFAQHVAGRELNNSVFGGETLGLCSFASPRRAKQDQSHLRRPRSFDLLIKPSYWCANR